MRFLFALSLLTLAAAFRPAVKPKPSMTELAMVTRRDALLAAGLAVVAPVEAARAASHAIQNREGSHTHGSTWFFDDKIEQVREESQMPTGGKLDLNNAAVVSVAHTHTHNGLDLGVRILVVAKEPSLNSFVHL